MARFDKFTSGGMIGALHHDRRTAEKHKNENIDKEKSHLNVVLHDEGKSAEQVIKENNIKLMNRKGVNVGIGFIIHLPDNVPKEDELKFFEKTREFLNNEKGDCPTPGNVQTTKEISCHIHYDEYRPHMQFKFVPCVTNEKTLKQGYSGKVSAKEWLSRDYLEKFHDRLCSHLTKELGYRPNIVNEDPAKRHKGKSLKSEEYKKNQDDLKELAAKIEEEKAKLKEKVDEILEKQADLDLAKHELENIKKEVKEHEDYIREDLHDQIESEFKERTEEIERQIKEKTVELEEKNKEADYLVDEIDNLDKIKEGLMVNVKAQRDKYNEEKEFINEQITKGKESLERLRETSKNMHGFDMYGKDGKPLSREKMEEAILGD